MRGNSRIQLQGLYGFTWNGFTSPGGLETPSLAAYEARTHGPARRQAEGRPNGAQQQPAAGSQLI